MKEENKKQNNEKLNKILNFITESRQEFFESILNARIILFFKFQYSHLLLFFILFT